MGLKLSTKKSLFEPFSVEIDDQVFLSRPFNQKLFCQLTDLEEKANKPDISSADKISALYEQITLVFGIPQKLADQLDIRDVRELLEKVQENIKNPVADLPSEAQKNASEPGGAESAS